MYIIETFKKKGGMKLLGNFWRTGTFLYAIRQILLTGPSKASLEIVSLGQSFFIQKKLRKRYNSVLERFDKEWSANCSTTIEGIPSKYVFVSWMQGIENAPDIVKRCYRSLVKNIKGKEIVLITSENLNEWTSLPEYILDKYKKGIITHTHFSDILRVELLTRHGGTWIDSTVFCSGGNIPKYMMDSELFMFQKLKPGAYGDVVTVSSWFMTGQKNNKILMATKELLWTYWQKENSLYDYFLVHHFIIMAKAFYPEDWQKMVQYPNSMPHILLLMLFEEFNQEKWDAVTSVCPFHKLTYKSTAEELAKEGTYYKYIMNN